MSEFERLIPDTLREQIAGAAASSKEQEPQEEVVRQLGSQEVVVRQSPRSADFNALVGSLEDLSPAWRLRDPGLGWCLAAFTADPQRFRTLVDYVIEAWNEGSSTKPLGLLCRLVTEDDE